MVGAVTFFLPIAGQLPAISSSISLTGSLSSNYPDTTYKDDFNLTDPVCAQLAINVVIRHMGAFLYPPETQKPHGVIRGA